MKESLETNGLYVLAASRPDLLAALVRDNFLPPPQLCLALNALADNVQDQEWLRRELDGVRAHFSSAVRETVAAILDPPTADLPNETA